MAPPITSARSVAAETTSACAQYARRTGTEVCSRTTSGRDRPVTRPSFADRYWTSAAIRFAPTSTHTSR
jgi:hypothetical protein